MSRHPISRNWKGPLAFLVITLAAFALLVWTGHYMVALGVVLVAIFAGGAYATGESSDLPGTAGDNDEDVPTKDSDIRDHDAAVAERTDANGPSARVESRDPEHRANPPR